MACPELVRNMGLGVHFEEHLFRVLHKDGQQLIRHWWDRSWAEKGCLPKDSFEPFIFCWIALNGWASCCTGLDQDRQWLDALIENPQLCTTFNDLLDVEPQVREPALAFHDAWPVFKAQELRRLGIMTYWTGNRQKTIDHYLALGAHNYVPECWLRHVQQKERVPLDWPHTLAALYRVRCNLFHGDKIPHSEIDRILVSNGFRVLVHFLQRHVVL